MFPATVVLNIQPELAIAEISDSDSESECFIFAIFSSFLFLSHDILVTVVCENHASSMFTITSINVRSLMTLIVK